MNTAQFVQIKGHRMALLDDKQSYLGSEQFSAREKIALRYCDAIMTDPTTADDAMWAELHRNFSEPEIVEIGHWVGFMSGGQRWLLTLHTQHGELEALIEQRKLEKAPASNEA
jgi:alkylhydroperoxidase family enzyme